MKNTNNCVFFYREVCSRSWSDLSLQSQAVQLRVGRLSRWCHSAMSPQNEQTLLSCLSPLIQTVADADAFYVLDDASFYSHVTCVSAPRILLSLPFCAVQQRASHQSHEGGVSDGFHDPAVQSCLPFGSFWCLRTHLSKSIRSNILIPRKKCHRTARRLRTILVSAPIFKNQLRE